MIRKILYWGSTVLLSLMYFAGATFYLTQPDTVRQALGHLGYPAYLIPILIAVKIAGPIALLVRPKAVISDLAYAGMLFHLLLAVAAHSFSNDAAGAVPAVLGLVFVATSFLTQNAARAKPSPYAPS